MLTVGLACSLRVSLLPAFLQVPTSLFPEKPNTLAGAWHVPNTVTRPAGQEPERGRMLKQMSSSQVQGQVGLNSLW